MRPELLHLNMYALARLLLSRTVNQMMGCIQDPNPGARRILGLVLPGWDQDPVLRLGVPIPGPRQDCSSDLR